MIELKPGESNKVALRPEENPQIGRRLRIIKFSGCVLQEILRALPKNGNLFRGMTSDAPADLLLMGFSRQCPWDDTYEFVVASELFDPVPEGQELPLWSPTFTAHYEEANAQPA